MKASGCCRRMDIRAPVSKVSRARRRICGGVVGAGRRALSSSRFRFALERREAILSEDGGGWEWSWESTLVRSEVDIVNE